MAGSVWISFAGVAIFLVDFSREGVSLSRLGVRILAGLGLDGILMST
jgi:hypothetical protein